MRVPNAGQDLIERRIVREGKSLAEAMLADYAGPPDFSLPGLWQAFGTIGTKLTALARRQVVRS